MSVPPGDIAGAPGHPACGPPPGEPSEPAASPKRSSQGLLGRLRAAGIGPRKSLGQHFLHDPRILSAIAEEARLGPRDRVLEVGTGPGGLTRELALRSGEVLTVEVDAAMLSFAQGELVSFENIRFLAADILQTRSRLSSRVVEDLRGWGPFVWVSNLPYNIATTLTVLLCESDLPWTRAVLTVQAEVAQRLAASAGNDAYGPVSLLIAFWADARAGRKIPAGAFWPPPKVESQLLFLSRRSPLGDRTLYATYRDWVKKLFSFRRKQLRTILRSSLGEARARGILDRLGWDGSRRPETLLPADVLRLAETL